MNKKILAVVIVAVCALSLVSCVGDEEKPAQEQQSESRQASPESVEANDVPNKGNPDVDLKDATPDYVVPDDSGTPDGFELGDIPNKGNPDVDLKDATPDYVVPDDSGTPDGFEIG